MRSRRTSRRGGGYFFGAGLVFSKSPTYSILAASRSFLTSVLASAHVEEQEDFAENAFTRKALEYLAEAGEIEDSEVCYYQAHGAKVNGYVLNLDDESLDLFVSVYTGITPPPRIEKAKSDAAFRNLRGFLTKAIAGLHTKLEESGKAFELSQQIHSVVSQAETLSRVRLFLVTDGQVNVGKLLEPENINGLPVSCQVWDIERLYRWYTSGHEREVIQIDLSARPGGVIPCLETRAADGKYTSYLTIVPGITLLDIYADFGPRLLERNVRSFLQARGAVNKGMQTTLKEESARFLAYNNGITATAASVTLVDRPGGGVAIKDVSDLQIVNGGQTTASLFHASRKQGVELDNVFIQMKLNVIHDAEELDEFVSRISLFANSQNKVNVADFSANDPFHRKIEEFSRNIWAPAADGAQRQTRWFYERARGQYADGRNRAGTPGKMREFESIYPKTQMFTKTDLAKYENTWMQRPHIVSRGAQKNFSDFTIELKKRGGYLPDEAYFNHIIAKALLFRGAEKLVGDQKYGGYRANIVTFLLALLSHATEQRIDLDRIWKTQSLTPALEDAIVRLSKYVKDVIVEPPEGRNVTEWCKSEKCWDACRALDFSVPPQLRAELIAVGPGARAVNTDISGADEADREAIAAVTAVSADTWLRLSSWAKETGNLQPWQRSLSYSIGRLVTAGRQPSRKQATQGLLILNAAAGLGFKS